MERRVVITGIGVITPIGIGKGNYLKALREGCSGIDKITHFDASAYSSKIAGEVKDFQPDDYIDKREVKRMDRFAQFAVAASQMALEDAKLKIDANNTHQVGVLIGSGIGGINTWEEQHRILLERGPARVSPFLVPMMICDMAAGQVAISLGAKGPNSCSVTACASATHAIGEAFEIIKRGDADVMISGGAEAPIAPTALGGFCSMRALSTRNDDPARASRPFDLGRDGFVMGEGAGIVILESLEHAKGRNAPIYAELIGYGMSADAYHITAPDPDGEGAASAMAAALRDAQIAPSEVNYINAHGTSTPLNDKVETIAIKRVFGDHAYKLPISSTKSMTGHLLGASGGIELIACILAITHNFLPPTINYQTPDPQCDLDYVPNEAREAQIDVAMSNSFGFGGHNATIIIKRI